jgi:hypothetical protein
MLAPPCRTAHRSLWLFSTALCMSRKSTELPHCVCDRGVCMGGVGVGLVRGGGWLVIHEGGGGVGGAW